MQLFDKNRRGDNGTFVPMEKRYLPKGPTPFKSNDEMVEEALHLIQARVEAGRRRLFEEQRPLEKKYASDIIRLWHRRFNLTQPSVTLAGIFKKCRLNKLEREMVMVLLLNGIGLLEHRLNTLSAVLNLLCIPASKVLPALRSLSEQGRPFRNNLIYYDDPEEDLCKREAIIDPTLLNQMIDPKSCQSEYNCEKDIYTALPRMIITFKKKKNVMDSMQFSSARSDFEKLSRRINHLIHQLDKALSSNPGWKFSKMRGSLENGSDWVIFLALLGKALNHLSPEDDLFTGYGLARLACDEPDEINRYLERLSPEQPLFRKNLIRPIGGPGALLNNNLASLQEVEFELTENALEQLEIQRHQGLLKDNDLIQPKLRLSDLALEDKASEAIRLVISHVQGRNTIMQTWGVGNKILYGRGMTLMFYGPPGTGKTATSEALAHELGRPLLIADYSKLQNCLVGQTEKNIVKLFRKATDKNAVLFWDECDAMFYDREAARQAWEVRDVNVLLQQIERFEGVCILATNRRISLDKALERRISCKVEFPRPGLNSRLAIWTKLIPKDFPLELGFSAESLADHDLSGGEIKNVILNASRIAYSRNSQGPVQLPDFIKAIEMEMSFEKADGISKPIGFHH